jgi:hypothetical protein
MYRHPWGPRVIARADPPKPSRRLRHPPPPVDQVRVSFTPYPAASPSADERLFGAFAALCRIAGDPVNAKAWQERQRQARSLPSAH